MIDDDDDDDDDHDIPTYLAIHPIYLPTHIYPPPTYLSIYLPYLSIISIYLFIYLSYLSYLSIIGAIQHYKTVGSIEHRPALELKPVHPSWEIAKVFCITSTVIFKAYHSLKQRQFSSSKCW